MAAYDHDPLSSSLTSDSPSYLSIAALPSSSDGGGHHPTDSDLWCLTSLSSNLGQLVSAAEFNDYSDAEIVADGIPVGVLRGVLAARSPFFHDLFRKDRIRTNATERKYLLSDLVPGGTVGYDAFLTVLIYLYTGRVRPASPDASTCVDEACPHHACVPAVDYHVHLLYACAAFQINHLMDFVERRLQYLANQVLVEDMIQIVRAAIHCGSTRLVSHCVHRIARVDIDDVIVDRTLPADIVTQIKTIRAESDYEQEHDSSQVKLLHYLNRKVNKRIYRALDLDDVQLVKLLLDESNLTLDETYALHYAAAFCSPKVFDEVWSLGKADLNIRNARGYTVLHIAAKQRDPSIALRVLEHGGCPMVRTWDGRTPAVMRRRITRPKDFYSTAGPGKKTNMDRLCIEILEREMRGWSLWKGTVPEKESAMVATHDLRMSLLLLENKVAMARYLFPEEARLAMHIARADSTSEFSGLSTSTGSSSRNSSDVDLNEMPPEQVNRLQQRLQALQKAVEASRRFFPNCADVVDKLVEDDTLGDLLLEKGSPEEQRTKRVRYMELKADLMKAFDKDMAKKKIMGTSSNDLLSSSLSFGSSTYLFTGGYELESNFESSSLNRLSSNLERLLLAAEYNDYSDAEVEADGISVGILRGLLATRSPFFHKLFQDKKPDVGPAGKPKYLLSELVPGGNVGYEAFVVILIYLYTGRLRGPPPEVATCIDEACPHDSCVPVVDYHVQLMYACHCLLNYVNKVRVEEIVPIVKAAIHSGSGALVSHCIQRIVRIDVDDVIIDRTLPADIVSRIKSLRSKSNYEEEHDSSQVKLLNYLNCKVIQRIYKALDSDDIQLVKLLLDEANLSLDAAYALHYAAAFCPPKVFDEVKSLGQADLNLRNARGYTVLHIAVRRKDPSIVLRVLESGGCVMDPTWDGRTALTIRRRLTRPKDFHEAVGPGKDTNAYRLCVEVLEREMWGSTWGGAPPPVVAVDDLQMKLLLLENRVAMARSLFPVETRLALHIAHADSTSEFGGLSEPTSRANLTEVNSNEMPPDEVNRLQQRLHALQKTVEAMLRFFPNCSEVVDKLLEDDTLGDLLLEEGSPEEQRTKRVRYMELKADLAKAFNKDMT
ncbi:ankyrin repeat family protein [Striga asiatica]|uniref:Ankyrin repeat family protein n=1 Tax=Striga asiatica TaxID=4170 RepID=A0A5A7QSM4_STRAF|nr:ankyrin repeat family protein [Striga asiatica]